MRRARFRAKNELGNNEKEKPHDGFDSLAGKMAGWAC